MLTIHELERRIVDCACAAQAERALPAAARRYHDSRALWRYVRRVRELRERASTRKPEPGLFDHLTQAPDELHSATDGNDR